MAVALHLYRAHPDWSESELDRARAAAVSRTTLSEVGRGLGLSQFLVVGQGEEQSGGRERASLLARAVEAIIGAVLVDAVGLSFARYAAAPVVNKITRPLLATVASVDLDVEDEAFLQRLSEELENTSSVSGAAEQSGLENDGMSVLEGRIAHRFDDRSLLREALTHSSSRDGLGGSAASNGRLAFVGDAVLGAVIAGFLHHARPDWSVMQMSRLKASAVSNAPLARIARALGLGDFLLLGQGEERSGGRDRLSVLATAVEALVGATYLDQPVDAERLTVRRVVLGLLGPRLKEIEREPGTDYKSLLQRRAQRNRGSPPCYCVREESGPDHQKTFLVEARVGKQVLGVGAGSSKKEAEQSAAQKALERLGSAPGPEGA
jgi:ribonuclease-3